MLHSGTASKPNSTASLRRVLSDTAAPSSYDALIARLSPEERLLRAIALSAYVRRLAWQGARLHAGASDAEETVVRFLQQLYGDEVALAWQRRTAATTRA
jgi:hypothetical protein